MNLENTNKAGRLLRCIGQIADKFLNETKLADEAPSKNTKDKIIKYSAIGVGASLGIAVAVMLFRPKRTLKTPQDDDLPKSA